VTHQPGRGEQHLPRPGTERRTVTDTAPHPPTDTALDLVLGERAPTTCHTCGKTLPALTAARFELEHADTGRPLCTICADKIHRGLRVAVLLLNQCLELQAAGQTQQAREALQAVVGGMEMILEDAPKPRYTRPIRHQPTRRTRHARRRS
jgi:hypothetical protein